MKTSISVEFAMPLFRSMFILTSIIFELSAMASGQYNPSFYQEMKWRMIGPYRGGRTVGATGVPGQPNVFYIGVNNGGVWKTNDYGRTWIPVFDNQPTGSVGALAVALSDPNIIYVGSGEGLQRPDLSTGDGMFKSTDGGTTWRHLGLSDAQQIGAIIVDPHDARRLYVAVLGHPYGANEERGVFRSKDGGETWEKILYKDVNTGAIALAFDPTNSKTIYADLWSSRQGPWENGSWQGKTSGLYVSNDGGDTWRQLSKGLPTADQGLGRIGIGIAPNSPQRMYAMVDATTLGGVYRSDDAGETWQRINDQPRLWGRGSDFAEIKVDPKNKDIVYIANTCSYRSTDGGNTFTAFKGAPGGDDYHTFWINPDNPDIILLASDQGAVITVNGGQTWSSWYNQPTAQLYHVITDNQFPYYVYSGQQESGSVGIASRGNDGEITFRDWHPMGVDEYAYVAPDPLNPNIIYGGRITRFDRSTGQVQNIAPEAIRSGKYRFLRTMPVLFSRTDPHTLYFASNVLFKTTNEGNTWDIISPDLSREKPEIPENIGIFRSEEMSHMARRGVIYAVSPSYVDGNVIWAGTDDGLVHITIDEGKHWENVTPKGITSWSKIAQIDAGRFDAKTAYVAVNRIRLDDMHPHIYRTHDGGKSWSEIINGMPEIGPVNVVREDPVRKGLLFAGTERAVYVSFNDGDDWQSLRLNMPATSIRDLVIHDDDIVVGTHGRSFWILGDITPLRQIDENVKQTKAFLFKPQTAYRVRWNNNTDTPLPPEEPSGQNPPDGAIINYYLQKDAGEVSLEIFDNANNLVRRFSSSDKPEDVHEKELSLPTYWIRPSQMLSAKSGMRRFVWDLHYAPPEGIPRSYPISAVYRNTASIPPGPWLLPGNYTLKLTVDGTNSSQSITVKMDPRVKLSAEGLQQQFNMSMVCYNGLEKIHPSIEQIHQLKKQVKILADKVQNGALRDSIISIQKKLVFIEGGDEARDIDAMYFTVEGTPRQLENLTGLQTKLVYLMTLFQNSDTPPTPQAVRSVKDETQALEDVFGFIDSLKNKEIKALNGELLKSNLPQVEY